MRNLVRTKSPDAESRSPLSRDEEGGVARALMRRLRGDPGSGRLVTPVLFLVVLLAVTAARSPGFFSSTGLANTVIGVAPLILAVLAMTPVAMSAPAGVDLAVGPLMVFVNAALVQWLFAQRVTNGFLVFGFAVVFAVGFEVLQGTIIALVRLQPIVVTLSGYLVMGGLALVVLPQAGGSVPIWLASLGSPSGFFSPALYLLAACLVLWGLFSRSTIARNISLLGGSERAAYSCGMRLVAVRVSAHVVAGVFAGIGGVLLTALLQSGDPTGGPQETLMAVTALVVGGVTLSGGRESGLGAVCGAIDIYILGYVLGTVQLGNASTYVTEAAYGAVLVLALIGGYLVRRAGVRRQSVSPVAG